MPRLTQQIDITANGSQYESYLKTLPAKTRNAVNKAGTSGGGGFGLNGFLSGAAGRVGLGGLAAGGGAALAGTAAIGAIVAVTAAFAALVKSTLDYADQIGDLSDQTNISTDDIQALGASARAGGKTQEDALKMLAELKSSRVEALEGNKEKMQAFGKFGITPEELRNATNLQAIAGKLNASGDVNRNALSDIVGKKNVGTFAAMQEDLADWESFKERLQKSGRLMSKEDIEAVAEFNDALAELMETVRSQLLPIVTPALREFSLMIGVVADHIVAAVNLIKSVVPKTKGDWLKLATSPTQYLTGKIPTVVSTGRKEFDGVVDRLTERMLRREKRQANIGVGKEGALDVGGKDIVDKKAQEEAEKRLKEQIKTENELRGILQKPNSDSLLSVGNFLGSNGTNDLTSIGRQQLEAIKEMAGYLRRIADRTNNAGVIG